MLVLVVELEANPAFCEELESMLRSMVDASGQEAGTIFYAAHRVPERNNVFVLYERYKDRAALDMHLQSTVIQHALKRFETMLATPPKITFCETIATTALGQSCV
ncbi:MAG TPA: putative quinol monooxygenase [Noviherbaspirillum sp.]|nr:putative quinol monooxygenase [Noviherbaspirillum sp.]